MYTEAQKARFRIALDVLRPVLVQALNDAVFHVEMSYPPPRFCSHDARHDIKLQRRGVHEVNRTLRRYLSNDPTSPIAPKGDSSE